MKALYQQIKRRREADGLSTNAGFTLIELLIVIVVLGILAGVVIFALGGVTGKSAISACKADGATVATAISAFNAQNPSVTVTVGTTGSAGGLLGNTLGGPYLQSFPANYSHYTFALSDGTSSYITTGTTAISPTPAGGTLLVNTNASTHTTGGALPADPGWAVYTPSACDNVQ